MRDFSRSQAHRPRPWKSTAKLDKESSPNSCSQGHLCPGQPHSPSDGSGHFPPLPIHLLFSSHRYLSISLEQFLSCLQKLRFQGSELLILIFRDLNFGWTTSFPLKSAKQPECYLVTQNNSWKWSSEWTKGNLVLHIKYAKFNKLCQQSSLFSPFVPRCGVSSEWHCISKLRFSPQAHELF